MARFRWKLKLTVISLVIGLTSGGRGGYAVTQPAATDDLQNTQTVECSGTGTELADKDLEVRIYTDGTYKNHGDGDYIAMSGQWEADVAPPTGGFGVGVGTVKVWEASQDPATDPEKTSGIFDFVNPP